MPQTESPLGPRHRADARTGAAGRDRTAMALQIYRRAHRHLRRRHGPAHASAAPSSRARKSSSARRGGCATISSANGFDASRLAAVVLDEADEMLDMGFREDLEFILDAAPEDRRTLMFSATMPKSIAALAKKYQRNALRIEVDGRRGRPCRHRISRHAGRAEGNREGRHQSAALLRLADRPRVLQHPRLRCAICRPPCRSAAFPPPCCPAN